MCHQEEWQETSLETEQHTLENMFLIQQELVMLVYTDVVFLRFYQVANFLHLSMKTCTLKVCSSSLM